MISACFITHNEEKNLDACLEQLAPYISECIVVDSGSTDKTISIAKKRHARVFFHTFENFASQRNYAIELSTKEWVLMIDPDERCSPKLLEELDRYTTMPYDAYRVHWKNYCDDKLIVTPWKTILFKRYARYSGDVHERIINIENKHSIEDEEVYITHHKTLKEQAIHLAHYREIILNMIDTKSDAPERIAYLINDHNTNVKRWLGEEYNKLLIPNTVLPWTQLKIS